MSQLSMPEVSGEERERFTEARFYSSYQWCLNPYLPLRELFQRLNEEMARYESLREDWQREEGRINLYLFACAVACVVDDYLAWGPWNLARLSARFRRWRPMVGVVQGLLNMPHALRKTIASGSVLKWRTKWRGCVDQVCDLLVYGGEPDGPRWETLRRTVAVLANVPLPEELLRFRMRLPEGFRCHDLTHQDVLALARRFAACRPPDGGELAVIGLRTAGAYFAPLAAAFLARAGWTPVSWLTIRPKAGLSHREKRQLRRLRRGGQVLLIDDHPNTGHTFRLALDFLCRTGVPPERVTVAAPTHPAHPDWTLQKDGEAGGGARRIALEPAAFHKAAQLDPRSVEAVLREYHPDWEEVHILDNPEVDAINLRLAACAPRSDQARLKRVFEVRVGGNGRRPEVKRVLAKSVGWGWLGYHAYLVGVRLAGQVPAVLGLRNGFLFSQWLNQGEPGLRGAQERARVRAVGSYVGRRVKCLPLTEDPCFDGPGYQWCGWDEMIGILRGVYGPYLGRLQARVLRARLRPYVSPLPTLVDGNMRADEWIETAAGLCKVDFEQHNFGGAELDAVDSAYDLSGAVFELALSEDEERDLLDSYREASGDRTIADRIPLYQLLYGTMAMRRSLYSIPSAGSGQERAERNARYLRAREFLTHRLNRFHADLVASPPAASWSDRLFFLDMDGVFYCELLGFPHTTFSGIEALELLRSGGFSVVPSTGRSVEHVRECCRTYHLPGGLAEFGSVFVDAVGRRELPLVDAEGARQLACCRRELEKIMGVFMDPGYQYSIYAYRLHNGRPAGLEGAEVEALLRHCRCDRLRAIHCGEATYVVQGGTGKGPGVLAVKRYLGLSREPVAAIGDSEPDMEMLRIAERSYAPANCAPAVRELAGKGGCRVVGGTFQRGLLEAVLAVLDGPPAGDSASLLQTVEAAHSEDILRMLLRVADRPRHRQFLTVLKRQGL